MGSFPSGAVGRARVSARNPRAFGVCDRCGTWYNHDTLQWQFEWMGTQLKNQRLLVCRRCYDVPQQQLRVYAPPADPLPIRDPRPELSDMGPLGPPPQPIPVEP